MEQVCSNSLFFFLLEIEIMRLLDGDNRSLLDPQSANSTFYIDSFNVVTAPPSSSSRQSGSPFNMLSATLSNPKSHTNDNQSTFYYQPAPSQFRATRPPPPPPGPVSAPPSLGNPTFPQPLSLKNLSLNPINHSNDIVTDLLDLGDPGSPPPSPKFDPYG